MGVFSGATFGLLIVVFWQTLQTGMTSRRLERKLDALLTHSDVDLSDIAVQEVRQAQQLAGQRPLLVGLALAGLAVGVACTAFFVMTRQ
jgi:hypothetical protein